MVVVRLKSKNKIKMKLSNGKYIEITEECTSRLVNFINWLIPTTTTFIINDEKTYKYKTGWFSNEISKI